MDYPENHLAEFVSTLQDYSKRMANYFTKIQTEYTSRSNDFFKSIKDAFDSIPEALKQLSGVGWYMSMHMGPGEINGLARLINEGNIEKVDRYLVDHFQKNYNQIKNNLIIKYPERKQILTSAFNAHERKDYYASIPLCLSQADGMCFDLTGKRPYRSKRKIPETALIADKFKKGSILNYFLQPLTVQGLINANQDERENFKGIINRHEILHGISLNYGTEIDGFKAISWLNYIGEVLEIVISEDTKLGQTKT
ncbi:MAG: hypothetical protein M0Q51_06495 [Bacteroidales bacterium]|nr:hypothetical protein [Bacteroidales bacterium]